MCFMCFQVRSLTALHSIGGVGFILYPHVTDKMSVEFTYFPRNLTFEMNKVLLQYRIGKSVYSVLNIEFRVCRHSVVFRLSCVEANNEELSISLILCMLCLIYILCSVVVLSLVKSLEEHNETMKNSVVEEPIINKVHSSNAQIN